MTKNRFATWLVSLVLMFAAFAAAAQTTLVSTTEARRKLSPDLQNALTASSIAATNWAKETSSGRMVKVLVLGFNSADPELDNLRRAIVNAGGSVYYRFTSINGVSAVLPAAKVVDLARRSDVESISPNRVTARTDSLLEKSTGASEIRGVPGVAGYDGAGVGIAFLDSGIMSSHRVFQSSNGASRVKKSVDLLKVNESAMLGNLDWKGGYDFSGSIYPGSSLLNQIESTINNATSLFKDPNATARSSPRSRRAARSPAPTTAPASPPRRTSMTCAC